MKASDIGAILGKFDLNDFREITFEMNPITITAKYLEELAKTPVNRISLGMQSMRDEELKFLQRNHTAAQVREKMQLLRSYGYQNISLDLMYGLPGQTPSHVMESLEEMLRLNPEHISTYCLSIEENTEFYKKGIDSAEEDITADMYELICDKLMKEGYRQYEISNFAREGFESGHNLAYWNCLDYLGLGPSAAGMIGDNLYHNAEDLNAYAEDVRSAVVCPHGEIQSPLSREKQFIFMNLRKTEGLQLAEFSQRFGKDFITAYEPVIQKYINMNLLTIRQDSIALNHSAYFISNEILSDFM